MERALCLNNSEGFLFLHTEQGTAGKLAGGGVSLRLGSGLAFPDLKTSNFNISLQAFGNQQRAPQALLLWILQK